MLVKPQADGYTNVVYIVYWTVSDTDGVNTAGRAGNTELPTVAGPDFIPYDQLTEAEVVGWVQSALGADAVNAIEANLNMQLVYMANPPVEAPPLPWSAG